MLKLSKEKWDEARDHAMRAVVPDNRMRAWYADRSNMDIGMLFTCRLGSVDLERPVGEWGTRSGVRFLTHIAPCYHFTPDIASGGSAAAQQQQCRMCIWGGSSLQCADAPNAPTWALADNSLLFGCHHMQPFCSGVLRMER